MQRISVVLIIAAALLSACAGSGWVRTPVVKQYDFAVAVEQIHGQQTVAPPTNARSDNLALSVVQKLMADLAYNENAGLKGKSVQKPAFQPVEIDRLAPVLTEALAKADTNQRIRFISFNQDQSALFSDSRKTEGVIFVAPDGRLNIAFSYINAKRLPSESSAVYSRYSEIDPLNIDRSETPISPVAAYAELSTLESGKPAPMWVVANLDKLREAAAPPAITVGETAERKAPVEPPQTPASSKPGKQPTPSSDSDETRQQDMKRKLRYLRELVSEGLISDDDYNAKKAELLKQLE